MLLPVRAILHHFLHHIHHEEREQTVSELLYGGLLEV